MPFDKAISRISNKSNYIGTVDTVEDFCLLFSGPNHVLRYDWVTEKKYT